MTSHLGPDDSGTDSDHAPGVGDVPDELDESGSDGFESADSDADELESLAAARQEELRLLGEQLRLHEQGLEFSRRFLSLRPLFRSLFTMFCGDTAGLEPSTLEGLAKTLFPHAKACLPGSDGLVGWTEFIGYMENPAHTPSNMDGWELL